VRLCASRVAVKGRHRKKLSGSLPTWLTHQHTYASGPIGVRGRHDIAGKMTLTGQRNGYSMPL
jgi:hypothetical protein